MPNKERKRKSDIVPISGGIKPSKMLTEFEQHVWDGVVNYHSVTFFEPCHIHQIEEYCKAIAESRKIDAMIDMLTPEIIMSDKEFFAQYSNLVKLKSLVVKDIATLATKLRLTKQSMHELTSARSQRDNPTVLESQAKKPWEE